MQGIWLMWDILFLASVSGDAFGKDDNEHLARWISKSGTGRNVVDKDNDLFSTLKEHTGSNLFEERTPMESYEDRNPFSELSPEENSLWQGKRKRSKRQIFFSLFNYWRQIRICRMKSTWRAWFNTATSNRNWVVVLDTDDSGSVLNGSKSELVEAIENGSRVKIRRQFYTAEVQNCRIINQEVCCQNLLHVSIQNWDTFQQNPWWWFNVMCTTGNMHIVRHYVGGNFLSQDRRTERFIWFVYRNKDGSYNSPLLSTDTFGNVTSGSPLNVEGAVRGGRSLTVLVLNSFLYPIQNVQLREGTVSAQHIWRLTQVSMINYLEFLTTATWNFILLTTSGSIDVSRWNVGSFSPVTQTNNVLASDWFAGDGWIEAFTTCSPFVGQQSQLLLKSKIEEGASIKVRFGETYLEVDNVMISGNQISVQVISLLAREDASSFRANVSWEFSTISTRGTIRTYRPLVGTSDMSSIGTTMTSQEITFYYDSRDWDPLLHISNSGTVLTGSALDVRNALDEGADIRVGYKRDIDPDFRFQTADNVFFDSSSSNVAVQLVRLLRDRRTFGDEFELDEMPVWSFTLINTLGFMRKTEWVVGENVNKGRSEERVEVKFFASF